MKSYKERIRRLSTVLLALMLCISFMPAGVFADTEDELQSEESTVETVADEQNQVNEEVVKEEPLKAVAAEEEPVECTHSNLKTFPAKKASCIKTGNVQYYKCPDCEKMFLDKECTQPVTDDSQITVPIDPSAHAYGDWEKTKEATPDEKGELTRVCSLCGKTDIEEFDYIEPIPVDVAKSFTLDGVKVTFKKPVCKEPEKTKGYTPGRVWTKGLKDSMKVCWKNASNLSAVDGVIILRATGSSKAFKEVKRIQFWSAKTGEYKERTSFIDKTAKKKNTVYTYRVVSYTVLSDITYISHISKNDWAAGQTGTSKLKNIYTAKMNKKSAKLQSKGTVTFKPVISKPITMFRPTSLRWTSSNKKVAVVSSKGKVTAKAPGSATIRCRFASGYEVSSKVTVVGAYKPGKPTLKVDFATTSSITLIWNKVKYATSYDIYKSNDGLHWDKTPINVKGTTKKISGLSEGHRYTFYVVARNDHEGLDANGKSKTYTALGDNSNVINQKAVVKRRPMTLTGFPKTKSQTTGTTLTITIKVNPPLGRSAQLQMKSGKKWVNKKTIKLPKGAAQASAKIVFPDSWWGKTTEWRLVIPPSTTTEGCTTNTLKLTAKRAYQNPSSYVQIKDKIDKHGYDYYVSPILVNGSSSKEKHVEALVKTAAKYIGDAHVQGRAGAPGNGIDASGLVIQACYGAGVDLWPISPSTRPYNCVPKIMSSKLASIKYVPAAEGSNNYTTMTRGDLIFFATSKGGTPTHVAIYTGLGGIVHADPVKGKVCKSTIRNLEDKKGAYKYYVVGVRRVFN